MQKLLMVPVIVAVAASLAGVMFASSNTINSNTIGSTLGTNTVISCSANSITLTAGNSARCGNWLVTLLNTGTAHNENGSNVSIALFSVYLGSNTVAMTGHGHDAADMLSGGALLRAVAVEQNSTSRACFHDAHGVMRDDGGKGVGHDCLLINASKVTNSSAAISLSGLIHSRNHPMGDINSWGENGQEDSEDMMQGIHRSS